MISKIFSIRNYIMKQLLKTDKSGIMKLPDKGNVDFGEMIIKEDLFKKGIDPKAITSETQLDSILNAPHVPTKPKKTGEVIDVDFDKGRWKDIDPEDLAYGGVAGMLGERDGYYKGSMAKSRPKKKFRFSPPWMGPSIHQREESHQVPDRVNAQGHGVNFPYKSLEDIPPDVLAMLMKDPVFDLETFLKKVAWSDPDKTRIQKKKKGEKEPPWGAADHYGNMLLYKQKFGKGEPIAGGALTLKSPSDADKVQTILHEMRHSKMREPWFMKSSAIPKYVRETEDPHYSFQKYGDRDDDPNKFVGGEELYIRYLDQLYGDVSEKGDIAGSDYKPYFDKILREEWAPHAKAYKEILEEEKRVKSKPYGLAGGGRTGSGLNYLLGEDDQNMRVPYGEGSSWEQFQKEKLMQKWQEYQQYLKNREKEERQKPYLEERLGVGPGPVLEAAEGGRARFAGGGMGRRAFLKLMAALGATGVAAKSGLATLLKGGAKTKALTSVPIGTPPGMPAWFKPLVNRVIKEGTDVSKKASTFEREIVHRAELPGSKTKVYVTQDLNTGDVAVDIGASKHGFADGHLGQPVRLQYKASEWIEPKVVKKGQIKEPGMKTSDEFWVEEAEFTGGHPENVKFEESTIEKFGQHGSDFTEVEKFATGKVKKVKPLKKREATQWNEGRAQAEADAAADLADDFASGGRVPLADGKKVSDPGYFMFQEQDEDRPFRYEYDPSDSRVMEKMKRLKEELIERGIIEQETFSEKDIMPTENNFLESMQNPFPKNTPEELENIKRNLRLKQQVKDGGRVPLGKGKIVKGLASLLQKKFPGTTKLGQTSRPMAPKTELKQAIAGFQKRNAPKIWEDKTKVRAAVDDIFPTGDYKYDAEMAAEALVENNPKAFGGKLIDDIDDATRLDVYGAVLRVITNDMAKLREMRKLSKPTKTLAGIKKTGTVNISDDEVASEFSRFMKETDPKGHRKIEEVVELSNFDPKGRKKNASGGLAGMLGE